MAKTTAGKTRTAVVDDCCVPSLLSEPLTEDDAGDLAAAFAALGDPIRLRCLSLIATAGECCSCDLEGPLQRAQPTISHHTKALADAGLIVGEKRGRWMWWQVVPERLDALRRCLLPVV
jgi:ArsR family transcriptional regulator, arsenate/arsenite/antimonite-responsive transcriptional repressor